RYLILPGWQGSPDDHWQSHWQRSLPHARRVEQADWDNPDPHAWVATLEREVAAAGGPLILVAHSLGCVTVVRWAAQAPLALLRKVRGALLVAPRSEEHTSELQSRENLVCRLLLAKRNSRDHVHTRDRP